MIKFSNLRPLAVLASVVSGLLLAQSAFAQDKGGGATEDDDAIIISGGVHTPPPVPEPFTMALGAGAVGLYARRRYVKKKAAEAAA
ncbi:MAG: PEP-CTERM sorting domain-containing protein [Verrucomicrobiaceae bacterium]|nr:MAG: PEP-CTERM sorting domain-containing protein [Verrucomicrobiaceae bacterium]